MIVDLIISHEVVDSWTEDWNERKVSSPEGDVCNKAVSRSRNNNRYLREG